MTIAEGKVGVQTLGDGSVNVLTLTKDGSTRMQQSHGRYQEAVLRGNVFFACNSASQALSLNSATATGLILTNPFGSQKNLVLLDVAVALLTAPAGISNLILTGTLVPNTTTAVTQTTPLIVRNAMIGNTSASVGLAASAATIQATPVIARPIGGGPVATGSVTSPFIRDELSGLLVLVPGTCISLQCLTTAISVIASMTWEEVSI